jgi:hypothetical protein
MLTEQEDKEGIEYIRLGFFCKHCLPHDLILSRILIEKENTLGLNGSSTNLLFEINCDEKFPVLEKALVAEEGRALRTLCKEGLEACTYRLLITVFHNGY